jgi:protein SCO1/2
MRALAILLLTVAPAVAGCGRAPETRQYELTGQILGVQPERSEVVIKHQDIKGFMPGMTMPFKVRDESLLTGKKPGDLVTATLVVGEVEAYLASLTTTGHAALDAAPAVTDVPRIAVAGDEIGDALLVDQDGAPRPFSTFRGHRLAVTFIYTRCPLPEFCPLMDRHFVAVQNAIKTTPALSDVKLLSVTLDPEFDTPQVLRPHAGKLGADPAVWSFMTGAPKDVAAFASQFGLYVERDARDAANILHNLRTAVVDARGRLVTAHTGNDWTPAQLVADLKATPAPAR